MGGGRGGVKVGEMEFRDGREVDKAMYKRLEGN
jgi:hypothetical protein